MDAGQMPNRFPSTPFARPRPIAAEAGELAQAIQSDKTITEVDREAPVRATSKISAQAGWVRG